MRKKKAKAGAMLGMTSVAGFENEELESVMNKFEKDLKKIAKKDSLDIHIFATVWEVGKRKKIKRPAPGKHIRKGGGNGRANK